MDEHVVSSVELAPILSELAPVFSVSVGVTARVLCAALALLGDAESEITIGMDGSPYVAAVVSMSVFAPLLLLLLLLVLEQTGALLVVGEQHDEEKHDIVDEWFSVFLKCELCKKENILSSNSKKKGSTITKRTRV